MPDYSEYIVVEKDEMKYYNHGRGDYIFLSDIFWGEQETLRIINSQSSRKESVNDNALTRIIIEKEQKRIYLQIDLELYESGVWVLILPRFLQLLTHQWKGWSISYLEEGYMSFLEYKIKFENRDYPEDIEAEISRFRQHEPDFLQWALENPVGTLVSIKQNDTIKYGFQEKNIAYVVINSIENISISLNNHVPVNRMPFGGIHFDFEEKKIFVWYSMPQEDFPKWVKKYWE